MVAGTKVCNDKLLAAMLDAIVAKRSKLTEDALQHLCLDKGYGNGRLERW
jgi:hypothetical protein